MSVKENIGAKFGVYKSGDLFLTRRSRRLRRTVVRRTMQEITLLKINKL